MLSCNQFVSRSMYPEKWLKLPELSGTGDVITPGRSAIVNPMGEIVAGPLEGREGMLIADIDLADIPRGKFDFDVTGHYARPDVFQLVVNRRPAPAVSWISQAPQPAPETADPPAAQHAEARKEASHAR